MIINGQYLSIPCILYFRSAVGNIPAGTIMYFWNGVQTGMFVHGTDSQGYSFSGYVGTQNADGSWSILQSQGGLPGWTSIDDRINYFDITAAEAEGLIGVIKNGLTAEVVTLSSIPAASNITPGSYFRISSPTRDYFVWFTVDGVGSAPSSFIGSGGPFCAVGVKRSSYGDQSILLSSDGVVWNEQMVEDGIEYGIRSIAWNGTIYCSIGYSAGYSDYAHAYTSPDGINWTQQSQLLPETASSRGIVWGGGQFMSVGEGAIYASPDGITWTEKTHPKSIPLWGITWSEDLGLFCAVGEQDLGVGEQDTDSYIITSPTGEIWTEHATPSVQPISGICWNGVMFCAVGNYGAILTSPDGIIWTAQTSPNESLSLFAITWNGSVFCAVGEGDYEGDSFIVTSPNGIDWTEQTNPKNYGLYAIAWNGTIFCAVGFMNLYGPPIDAYIVTSPTGVTWTEQTNPNTLGYLQGICVATPLSNLLFGGIGIQVDLLSTDTANQVAIKIAAALDGLEGGAVFSVPVPPETTVVVTNVILGPTADVVDGGSTSIIVSHVDGTETVNYSIPISDELTSTDYVREFGPEVVEDEVFSEDRVLGQAATPGTNELYHEINEESLAATDGLKLKFYFVLLDTLNGSDLSSGIPIYSLIVSDGIFGFDEAILGWMITVPESLTATDEVSSILGLLISDWLTLTDKQVNNWHGVEVILESVTLYDVVVGTQLYSKTIEESLTATDVVTYQLLLNILESLEFTDLISAMKSIAEVVEESVAIEDETAHGFDQLIAEILSAVDVSSVIGLFLNTISESLTATDDLTIVKHISGSVTESLVFVDAIRNKGSFYSVVYDTLHLNIEVELEGDIWECYVLNTPKFYPSVYSGFDFNSFCVFENRAFGANDTGIYELTGETDVDSTIHTGAILGKTDFGSPNQKRFRRGYIGIFGDNPVMVFETESGHREAYAIDTEGKIAVSSELKSKSWKLSISDFDELNTIKLIPVILTK